MEVAEQKVDVEAALVCLIDDDGVVSIELAVALDLSEQKPICHDFDLGVLADAVVESHGVADITADGCSELLCDALGHRTSCDTSRLGVADERVDSTAKLETHLRKLGALPGPRLSGDDNDLVIANRGEDLFFALDHRKVGGIPDCAHDRR